MSMTRGAKLLMVRNETNRGNQTNREYGRMEHPDMNYDMRSGEGDMRLGGRSEYGDMSYPRYEYGGMNYGESRFRDRRGREHYDNGRFAPRNEIGERRGEEMRSEDMRPEGMEMRGNYGGQSHYPFGPVPPVYERGAEMNRIGFVVPIGQNEVGGNFRNDASYSEMGHQRGEMMRGGASGEGMMLTEDMAHEWMRGLKNEDGTKGPHWNIDQVKQVMSQRGIKEDPTRFWVALNAAYSDLCGVAKKHGVNTMDYYIDYAKAFWFDDKDAVEDKLCAYFMNVVK